MPLYDELSVKNIYPRVKDRPDIEAYFPYKLPQGRLPERQYFWNVLNTKVPEYVDALIKHANELRHSAKADKQAEQVIAVTEEWWEKLNELPFISCKFSFGV